MNTLKVTFGFPPSSVTYTFGHPVVVDTAWLEMPLDAIEFIQDSAHQIALTLQYMDIETVRDRLDLAMREGSLIPTSKGQNGDLEFQVTFANLMALTR